MGGIGGHRGEGHPGAGEPTQRGEEVFGERWSVRVDEVQGPPHIETVDDNGGSSGWVVPVPRLQDATVVVDRGFRPESADDPDCRHLVTLLRMVSRPNGQD
jgi:hypothetical protein